MIGKLKGKVEEILEAHVLLDVTGVCYLIGLPTKILSNIVIGQKLTLWIDHVITENSERLYGYQSKEEKNLAALLVKVKGISHRIAGNLVDILGCGAVISAIQSQKADLLRVPGVGGKLAERIVSELHGQSFMNINTNALLIAENNMEYNIYEEALSALEVLGYAREEARAVISDIMVDGSETNDVSALIKCALSMLSNCNN